MTTIEKTIITNLLNDEEYLRKVSPHLKVEYFKDRVEALFVQKTLDFFIKYNEVPNRKTLAIELAKTKPNQEDSIEISNILREVNFKTENQEWLLTETEKFCKQQAIYGAILDSFDIIEGKNSKLEPDAIPDMLSKALSVCFDTNVGLDYSLDAEARWEFYNRKEEKIPFDLKMLNGITLNGLSRKTLNLIAAGTGHGKSLLMCHIAARALAQGYNVLYISLEMAAERIAQRIDANLMNINVNDVPNLDKDYFLSKIDKIKAKTNGTLKIKEYPTGSAHSGHFRALIDEYKQKQQFVPDLLIVDYLSICASSRLKMGGSVNSYSYIKSIAEELRAIGVEYDVPVLSAIQTTRSANVTTDVDVSDIAESFGIAHTGDLIFALIRTEELDALNQVLIRQIKNRYSDMTVNNKFILGLDRGKMRFYDVEDSGQAGITDVPFEPDNKQKPGKFEGLKF